MTMLIFSATIEEEKINIGEANVMKPLKLLKETWEVDSRLAELGLDKSDLIEVVKEAVLARNNCTDNDPANAPGWFAWSYGTRALRDKFCLKGWKRDRKDSIESIFNENAGIKVVFQNVDCAADDSRFPKTRSQKGASSERAVTNNQYEMFPEYQVDNASSGNAKIWFLCVSTDGEDVRAELSLPSSLENGQFFDFIERISIVNEGEWDKFTIQGEDDRDDLDDQDFEVNVVRK